MLLAFLIWAAAGALFIGIGINDFFTKKQAGFWANSTKPIEVKDVKKYNRAVGTLLCAFGLVFILIGLPFLCAEENSIWIFLPMIAVPAEIITMVLIYVTVIEKKHRK